MQDEYAGASGSVIAADFYRAGALLPLPDEDIVARVLRNLQFCEPGFLGAKVFFFFGVAFFKTMSWCIRARAASSALMCLSCLVTGPLFKLIIVIHLGMTASY